MALLSAIRRWHFREGMPIREISRRTGLSRNTVRKYLASGVVESRYPKRKSPSKLDDYELTLTSWLFRESQRHRKQRKTLKQLHSDLVQLGHTGSYDRVAAFARAWRQAQQEAKKTAAKKSFGQLWQSDKEVLYSSDTKLPAINRRDSASRRLRRIAPHNASIRLSETTEASSLPDTIQQFLLLPQNSLANGCSCSRRPPL